MRGNVAFTGRDRLGQLPNSRLHRSALVSKRLLTLTLSGDTQACFSKFCCCSSLGVTQEGNL